MSKKPPNRPGVTFEVGAKVEAQDYLHKWYPSHIEKIDYKEGKVLVHFDRWSHRYDEWIYWGSNRLRPLERPALRKEGLKEENETIDLRSGEEVLARWTDCRYYPAKIQSVNKEGIYRVQFYDGVVRSVKRMHIRSMPEDAKRQANVLYKQNCNTLARATTAKNNSRTCANSIKDQEYSLGSEAPEDEEHGPGVTMPATLKLFRKEEPKQYSRPPKTVSREEKGKLAASHNSKGVRFHNIGVSKGAKEDQSTMKGDQGNAAGLSEEWTLVGAQAESPAVVTENPITATTTLLTKLRSRWPKHASEKRSYSLSQSKLSSYIVPRGEEEGQSTPTENPLLTAPLAVKSSPSTPGPSEQSQQRRRSQRLALWAPAMPMSGSTSESESDHKVPQGELSVLHVDKAVCLRFPRCTLSALSEANARLHHPPHPSATDPPFLSEDSKPATDISIDKTATPDLLPVALPHETPPLTVTEVAKQTDIPTASDTTVTENLSQPTPDVGLKTACRIPKPHKHAREPIMNTIKSDKGSSPKDSFFDLDHNKFSCKVPGCSKAFRKAKLLEYHLKYYHNTEKEVTASSLDKEGRTRATSASLPRCTPFEIPNSTRRRTVSTSACNTCSHFTCVLCSLALPPQNHSLQLECYGTGMKLTRTSKKKRSSASVSSDGSETLLPVPSQEQTFDTLHNKIVKKVIDKERYIEPGLMWPEKKIKLEETHHPIGKKKEKERKDKKDPLKIKQKKKKKKKKKSEQCNLSDFEILPLSLLERCSSPHRVLSPRGDASSKPKTFQYPRAILSVDLTGENLSDIDFLEDSSTESLFLSGDEYGQDLDSITMDDFQEDDKDDEEKGISGEVVRCICEMDDESGFMIQCEVCMCWQHSVCMGLLEDCIPDLYVCYVCRDPQGQRWSAKYQHDKEWLNKGHMYGLPFLSENYSRQNAKKIVSTHQLLADVFSVKKVLHGLQLKMDILQRKHNPSLHLWARSWENSDNDNSIGNCPDHIIIPHHLSDSLDRRPGLETYIASDHNYQKPSGLGLNPWSSNASDKESNWEAAAAFVLKEEKEAAVDPQSGCLSDTETDVSEPGRSSLQWQLNLLNHIEDVQNQVARRMDLIEKELDVLESWLDFTGELEPPDPLARLPQLQRRIKQLLSDLGKVQQMGSLCSI
ncbi:PHD finger protein 20-like protein 1 isoform X6 [Arapaima gigas]